jgi:hypothetical protein
MTQTSRLGWLWNRFASASSQACSSGEISVLPVSNLMTCGVVPLRPFGLVQSAASAALAATSITHAANAGRKTRKPCANLIPSPSYNELSKQNRRSRYQGQTASATGKTQ